MADHNYEDTNMDDESKHINSKSSIGNDGQIDLAPNDLAEHRTETELAKMKTVHIPKSVDQGADGNERGEFYVAGYDAVSSNTQIESLAGNEISMESKDDGILRNHEEENSHLPIHLSDVTPMDQDQDVTINDSKDLGDIFVGNTDSLASGEDTIKVECDQSATPVFAVAQSDDISSIPLSGVQGNIPNESDSSLGRVQDSNLETVHGLSEVLASGISSLPPASTGITIGGNVSPKPNTLPLAESALGVLSNYGNDGSDSWGSDDNEDEVEVVPSIVNVGLPNVIQLPTKAAEYRTIQPSSDDSESDSSESSEDCNSGSSSESLDDRINSSNTNKPPETEVDVYDEPESAVKEIPRTKGEATLDDLPPIADLQISVPEEAVIEMGIISSIVEQQVVVQAKQNFPPMNLDTVLFLEKGRRPLGQIFDVFGQVTEPFYSVRFNSADHVKERRIETGMAVYCAPHTEHTNYVFVDELMKVKGSDASWRHNNETPSTFLDFSDDEAEQQARRQAKASRSMNQSTATDCGQPQRKRVNSFERRMNERNLQKSALPPEPCHALPIPPRAANAQRGKRPKPVNPFAVPPRSGRGAPSPGPAFPSPSAPPGPHPRPPQHGWEWVDNMDQSMGFPAARHSSPLPPTYGRQRGRGFPLGGRGRGYGFGPVPTPPMPFAMGQGLPQHENPQQMRFGGPHSTSQPGGPMALAYSMGHHMQPSVNNQSMVYQPSMMQGSQRPMFPVLLRQSTFQAGPPHYDANSFVQNVPFGSPSQAFPQCYSSGPPPPPARGQSYNPMFSGVPMFNPGFPPPQIRPPPRSAMFPIGPPPPPRGV